MKKRPFSDVVWLCELHRQKGVKLGKTYMNENSEKSTKEFTRHISEAEREKQLTERKLTDLLSIKLLAAPISSFDPVPATEHWNQASSQPRRPNLHDDGFKSQILVDGETSNEPAHTVADAADPVTTTGGSTDFVSAVVDADDAPDSESADHLEDENSEFIEKYNYIAW